MNSKDGFGKKGKARRARGGSVGKRLSLHEELAFINQKYKSILQSQEERILYRPVKAYKLKPKNLMRMF